MIHRSSSGQQPVISISAGANMKGPVSIKLDMIGKLSGQDNYRIWSSSITIV